MNPEFAVYDNLEQYNKINEYNGNPNTRLDIIDVWIKPPMNAFWFETNMDQLKQNVDLKSTCVHIHPRNREHIIGPDVQFTKKTNPIIIQKQWMHYNPKTKEVYIRNSILPWHKPLWKKHISNFYGTDTPKKNTKIQGLWMFDHTKMRINLILNLISYRDLTNDEKLKVNA